MNATSAAKIGCALTSNETQDQRRLPGASVARKLSGLVMESVGRTAVGVRCIVWLDGLWLCLNLYELLTFLTRGVIDFE